MNSFLSSEIEGRPEEHRVAGTLTSRYCFVHILYLLNAKRSSDWHIISPTLKEVRQWTKSHLRLTVLPNVVKASAEIHSSVQDS